MASVTGAGREAARALGSAARVAPGWMRALARVGFGAKGVVYLIVGGLAMQGAASDQQGALTEIASQPFGRVLLGLVALGLAAYAAWRFVSGAIDPHDETDDDAKGTAKRVGYVASGVVYAALAVEAARMTIGGGGGSGAGGSGAGGSGDGAQHWTGKLLEMDFGPVLVGLVALGVAVGAAYQLKQAITADFRENFLLAEMSPREDTWATRAGRLGHAARAVVYGLIAWFLARAALAGDEDRAGGLGKALETLQSQPWGSWMLVAAGLGLVCYGLYCFVVARYCDASS